MYDFSLRVGKCRVVSNYSKIVIKLVIICNMHSCTVSDEFNEDHERIQCVLSNHNLMTIYLINKNATIDI